MGVTHLDAAFLELPPHGAMVDVEVLTNPSEGLAVGVQPLCLIDLLGREATLADLDPSSL